MARSSEKHIDAEELGILFPWSSETAAAEVRQATVEVLCELHRHLAGCSDCRKRLMAYRRIVGHLSNATNSGVAAAGPACPSDLDWNEVAAGLWPKMKADQLIRHAAVCDHCGPLLRAATRAGKERLSDHATVPEHTAAEESRRVRWPFLAWFVPLCSAAMIVAVVIGALLWSKTTLSAAGYAEFAVRTHTQFEQGNLNLDVRSDSMRAVNDWLRQNVEFKVSLPASPGTPAEKRPFDLKGASVVHVGRRRAAFIAYQMDSGAASLMIAPYKIAVASGGVEARFKKVTFHYRMVDGFKVVTWSQHGLTYALVSQEGTRTQKSCMVCHSAMRDRDLTNTPAPLDREGSSIRSYLQ